MNLGYKQQSLINTGKSKGFVSSNDVLKYYRLDQGKRVMNGLVCQGFFKPEVVDKKGLKVIWEIK